MTDPGQLAARWRHDFHDTLAANCEARGLAIQSIDDSVGVLMLPLPSGREATLRIVNGGSVVAFTAELTFEIAGRSPMFPTILRGVLLMANDRPGPRDRACRLTHTEGGSSSGAPMVARCVQYEDSSLLDADRFSRVIDGLLQSYRFVDDVLTGLAA